MAFSKTFFEVTKVDGANLLCDFANTLKRYREQKTVFQITEEAKLNISLEGDYSAALMLQ